jgi:hypothetical protein
MKINTHFLYLVYFFLEWKIFRKKVLEKIKIHTLYSETLFLTSCRLWDNVGKSRTAGKATDNMMRGTDWVFKWISLRLCHLQNKLIGFYNRVEKCLQRGTNWVFKWISLRSVF